MFAGYTINLPSNLTKDFNTVLVTLLNKLELKRWKWVLSGDICLTGQSQGHRWIQQEA